jgi:hypothetical protein
MSNVSGLSLIGPQRFICIFPDIFLVVFSMIIYVAVVYNQVFYSEEDITWRSGVIDKAWCIRGSKGTVTLEILDKDEFFFWVPGHCKNLNVEDMFGLSYRAAFIPGIFSGNVNATVLVDLEVEGRKIVDPRSQAVSFSILMVLYIILPSIFFFFCFSHWRRRTFADLVREALGEGKVDEGMAYKRPALERMRHLVRTDPRWKRDFERCVEIERENRKAFNQINSGNEALLATLEQRISVEGSAVFSSSDIYGRKEVVTVVRNDSSYRLAISYNDQPPAEEDFTTLKDAIEHMHEICMSRLDGYKSGVKRTL